MDDSARRRRTSRIEAALWIVLGVLAFLAKDNPRLVYPHALYMFLALLASSFATSLTVRLAPEKGWLHALTLIAGFGAIAGVQEYSGGPESNLWTLYLLPLFSAAILLDGRSLLWTAMGACATNAVLYFVAIDVWSEAASFELALKTGILASAAGATWILSRGERDADARARRNRAEIESLEDTLRRAAKERESDRGLTAIAAGGAAAVHDLTTPLMVVRAYSRMHLENGVPDETLGRDLERIDKAAGFCQELVAAILARRGGPDEPRRISTIIETAVTLADPVLRARKVAIQVSLPAEHMVVMSSRQDLERVLLNLVGNAAKAMPDGGKIRVRAERDDGGSWPWAVVTVEDEGPGIPPEILPRLFQPFATTREGKGGTGLGLYLSRETARRLGGGLDAENRREGGARFILRLPLAPADETAPAAAPEGAAAGGL